MQWSGRRWFATFIAVALSYIILSGIVARATRTGPIQELENQEWIASGKYWLDRQICSWLGLCGTMHLRSSGWTWQREAGNIPNPIGDASDYWQSGKEDPDSWSDEEIARREIPQYVFEHAPYVHLFSGEQFWPCDMADHLMHTTARLNYTTILDMESDRNLSNLNELNDLESGRHGRYVYLQSNDNVENRPSWLGGSKNIPNTPRTKVDLDPVEPWSTADELSDKDSLMTDQQKIENYEALLHAESQKFISPLERIPSQNGRCGGNSGYTCQGSRFGKCCSIHGWCGTSDEYCEDLCDPLAGTCNDPLNPPLPPKPDLRRRKRGLDHDPEHHEDPNKAGRSSAPAILVTVDKGNGTLDAFWFFFYSYNLGQTVFNIRFGNHVGDWEHTLVRFQDGKPEQVFLSEHTFGEAYAWSALEKYLPNPDGSETMLGTFSNYTAARAAKRPVVYSAIGSHAMYGTPGLHPYILPWGLLHDQTDRGPLWDPALNARSFTYEPATQTVRASTRNPKAPVGWFHYSGHWGDKYYPLSDPRQYRFAGQYHYVNGPTGPKFKNLGRTSVCQRNNNGCEIKQWLGGTRAKRIYLPPMPNDDEGDEEGGLPGGNSTDEMT